MPLLTNRVHAEQPNGSGINDIGQPVSAVTTSGGRERRTWNVSTRHKNLDNGFVGSGVRNSGSRHHRYDVC